MTMWILMGHIDYGEGYVLAVCTSEKRAVEILQDIKSDTNFTSYDEYNIGEAETDVLIKDGLPCR